MARGVSAAAIRRHRPPLLSGGGGAGEAFSQDVLRANPAHSVFSAGEDRYPFLLWAHADAE
jgi:hypothetical protein